MQKHLIQKSSSVIVFTSSSHVHMAYVHVCVFICTLLLKSLGSENVNVKNSCLIFLVRTVTHFLQDYLMNRHFKRMKRRVLTKLKLLNSRVYYYNNNNNNNLLHLYSAFLGTQSTLNSKGDISSPTTNVQHSPGWCDRSYSVPTTHQLIGGEEKVMKPISVWGCLGGHDGQRPVGEFG